MILILGCFDWPINNNLQYCILVISLIWNPIICTKCANLGFFYNEFQGWPRSNGSHNRGQFSIVTDSFNTLSYLLVYQHIKGQLFCWRFYIYNASDNTVRLMIGRFDNWSMGRL